MSSVGDGVQLLARADRCPGLLRPHFAEDGPLVRLRFPGGQTDSSTLLELSRIAGEFGEGSVQLTSRGNVQLRGLDQTRLPELVERVAAAGLLPSPTHERVRNVVASPLTGLGDGYLDLRPMIAALDSALCATPALAELPGRFLFALDDGSGDVRALRFDLAFFATGHATGIVAVGNPFHGIQTTAQAAVGLLLQLAGNFLRERNQVTPPPWQVAGLAQLTALDPRIRRVELAGPDSGPLALGAVAGAASVGVPLSFLNRQQAAAVDRAAAGGPVVITPWRGLVIPGAGGALPELVTTGLIADESSAWSQLTACVGAPGCARSAIRTQTLTTRLASALPAAPRLPVHLSGCERRCGAPAGAYVDLVAPRTLSEALAAIEGAS